MLLLYRSDVEIQTLITIIPRNILMQDTQLKTKDYLRKKLCVLFSILHTFISQ